MFFRGLFSYSWWLQPSLSVNRWDTGCPDVHLNWAQPSVWWVWLDAPQIIPNVQSVTACPTNNYQCEWVTAYPQNNSFSALDALPSIQSEPRPSVWWVWHVIYVSMSAGMALPGLSSCHTDLSWSPIDYYPGSHDLPGDQSQASIQVTWPVWTNHSWLSPWVAWCHCNDGPWLVTILSPPDLTSPALWLADCEASDWSHGAPGSWWSYEWQGNIPTLLSDWSHCQSDFFSLSPRPLPAELKA